MAWRLHMDASLLRALFHLDVPVLEKIIRPILVYLFLIVGLRLAGKRELAQLNPFDLVVLLSLSNTVQNAIIGNDNSVVGGLIGAFSLLLTNYLVVRFLFRHGRVDHKGLAKELLTESEVTTVCLRQGFAHISEIESCVLEPGAIATIGHD